MSGQTSAWWLKLLKFLLKSVSWGIILVSALVMPLFIYQFYAVIWGGIAPGETIFFDANAPARGEAAMELALNLASLAGGILLEHFGLRAINRFGAGGQAKA